jgi:hypothetical protein
LIRSHKEEKINEEFAEWLDALPENLRRKILGHVELLERLGPNLGRPRVDGIKGDTDREISYPL